MRIRPSICISVILLLALSCVAASSAERKPSDYKPVSGLEWLEMSAGDRVDNLMAAMYLLNKSGVELSYTVDHYYDAVYQKLQRAPNLYTSGLNDVLALYVYEKEPNARARLDQLRNRSK